MLTAQDIKNITFSNAMGGYKKDEVDVFLDSIEADYEKTEKIIAGKDARISDLEKRIEELEKSKGSIQNVLISAQGLADQIVAEAKSKSAEIVAEAQKNVDEIAEKGKKITTELDARALEKKERLEAEIAEMLKTAENKKSLIEQAATVTVKKQQELYAAIKAEMNAFKNDITEKYKEHLLLLSKMQTSTELDPEKAADLINENYTGSKEKQEKPEQETIDAVNSSSSYIDEENEDITEE